MNERVKLVVRTAAALLPLVVLARVLAVRIARERGFAFVRNVLAIAGKECRAILFSPVLYVVVVPFGFFNGLLFGKIVQWLAEPDAPNKSPLQIYFEQNGILWVLLAIIVPVITMRLLAEEKRTGTLEVLLTAPVSDLEVVLGKFLAGYAFFVALWLPTIPFVLVTAAYAGGEPGQASSLSAGIDLRQVAATYLGLLLVGAYYAAFGLLASSLTRNQIVAAVIGFLFFLAMWLFPLFPPPKEPTLAKIVQFIRLDEHLSEFSRGIVDTRRIVWYGSLTAFGLFLATRVVEARRWK